MTLKNLAEDAVTRIGKTVSAPLTEPEVAAIAKIIDNLLIKAVSEATKNSADAAVVCCGPEADLSHKIAEGVDRARQALIANLTSMR